VHVFGEGLVGVPQDAGVMAQAAVDAARPAALLIDRETRRQGERPLFEPLGTEQLIAEGLFAVPFVANPGMEEQTPSYTPRTVPAIGL